MPDLRAAAIRGLPPRVVVRLDDWAAARGIRPDDDSWAAMGAVLAAALPVIRREMREEAEAAAQPLIRLLNRGVWVFCGVNLAISAMLIAMVVLYY